jgi:photosystem II stability/assembly factor-like uncharacterized protein
MMHHAISDRGTRTRLWATGATIAVLVAALALAGCDLSSLTGAQCTPTTCDYFLNTFVAAGGSGSVTLLADSNATTLYQYSGSTWNKVSDETATQHGTLFASPNFASDKTLFLGNTTSTDGGQTWQALCATVIAVSPNFATDHTVYGINAAQTGSGSSSSGVSGCPSSTALYDVSTDGGKTWQGAQAPQNAAGQPTSFTLSPQFGSDKTIFADFTTTQNQQPVPALYVSTDGGQTWTKSLSGQQSFVSISPNFDQDHFVVAFSASGLQESADGGQTWQAMKNPLNGATDVAEVAFSPNYASDKTMVLVSAAVDQGSSAAHGTYVSTDGGQTWTQTGSVTQRGVNQPAIVFSPNYASDKTIYASSLDQDKGPASSTDLGKTWTAINSGLPQIMPSA